MRSFALEIARTGYRAHDPDDIAQDVTIRYLRLVAAGRVQIRTDEEIEALVRKGVRFEVMNRRKAAARGRGRDASFVSAATEHDPLWMSPADSAEVADLNRDLRAALRALPGSQRRLVIRRISGAKIADIAAHYGISEQHAKNHLAAAFRAMADQLPGHRPPEQS
jgi:DNA-directed RNA polymerase specialized sigma24 family protein